MRARFFVAAVLAAACAPNVGQCQAPSSFSVILAEWGTFYSTVYAQQLNGSDGTPAGSRILVENTGGCFNACPTFMAFGQSGTQPFLVLVDDGESGSYLFTPPGSVSLLHSINASRNNARPFPVPAQPSVFGSTVFSSPSENLFMVTAFDVHSDSKSTRLTMRSTGQTYSSIFFAGESMQVIYALVPSLDSDPRWTLSVTTGNSFAQNVTGRIEGSEKWAMDEVTYAASVSNSRIVVENGNRLYLLDSSLVSLTSGARAKPAATIVGSVVLTSGYFVSMSVYRSTVVALVAKGNTNGGYGQASATVHTVDISTDSPTIVKSFGLNPGGSISILAVAGTID